MIQLYFCSHFTWQLYLIFSKYFFVLFCFKSQNKEKQNKTWTKFAKINHFSYKFEEKVELVLLNVFYQNAFIFVAAGDEDADDAVAEVVGVEVEEEGDGVAEEVPRTARAVLRITFP